MNWIDFTDKTWFRNNTSKSSSSCFIFTSVFTVKGVPILFMNASEKVKFAITIFCSIYDGIGSFLRTWSHLLKNHHFCVFEVHLKRKISISTYFSPKLNDFELKKNHLKFRHFEQQLSGTAYGAYGATCTSSFAWIFRDKI